MFFLPEIINMIYFIVTYLKYTGPIESKVVKYTAACIVTSHCIYHLGVFYHGSLLKTQLLVNQSSMISVAFPTVLVFRPWFLRDLLFLKTYVFLLKKKKR